jgi:hypothetical protein
MSGDGVCKSMNAAERGEFLGARRRRLFVAGAAALGAAIGAGCVREYPAGLPVPGVRCDAGICVEEVPDRRSASFPLAPGCWASPAATDGSGINAQRMTLASGGYDVVFSGSRTTTIDGAQDRPGVAIATFDASDACPAMDWPSVAEGARAIANGAHLAAPNGGFWSLVGDPAGTQQVVRHDDLDGWSPPLAVENAPAPMPASDFAQFRPNSVAVALHGGRAAVVRSQAKQAPVDANQVLPTVVEWLSLAAGAPRALAAPIQVQPGQPGYLAISSMRGQVRLFPRLDDVALAEDRLVLIGDAGWPMTFSRLDPSIQPLSRRADDDLLANLGSAAVLLPLRPEWTGYSMGMVLFIGGGADADVALRQRLDLFDPASGDWVTGVGSLPGERRYAAPVLLPDGRIMLAGGSASDLRMLYIDPSHGFVVTVGRESLTRTRTMGVGGLVLADGRVVVAGGHEPDGDGERAPPDLEIWEPPYLHRAAAAPRLSIVTPPGTLRADATFSIRVEPAADRVAEVVLLAYSSSFLGNNLNQRLIELQIAARGSGAGAGTIAVRGPRAAWAPAGRYLLFVLDRDRVPSAGVPVDVVEEAAAP